MFSYGSGTVASLYSLQILDSDAARGSLSQIVKNNDIGARFEGRTKMPCDAFEKITDAKLQQFHTDDHKSVDLMPAGTVAIEYFYPKFSVLTLYVLPTNPPLFCLFFVIQSTSCTVAHFYFV